VGSVELTLERSGFVALITHSTAVEHPVISATPATASRTHKEVRMALSFSKVISAVLPDLTTLTSFPQNEKKSCSFSSVVSAARPATWMV